MKRRLITGLVLVFALLSVSLAWNVHDASAQARDCDNWYGRGCLYGYFDNEYISSGDDVIIGGMPNIPNGDKQAFINRVEGYLSSGVAQNITGGQFIVQSMLGRNGGVGRNVDAAMLADWRNRINNPAISMQVENVLYACGIANSYYQVPYNDVAAGYSTPSGGCGKVEPMINFYHNGTLVYQVRVACANPLGTLPGLPSYNPPPPPQPPTTITCGPMNLVPAGTPTAGQWFRIEASASFSGGPPTPSFGTTEFIVSPNPGNVDHSVARTGNTINFRTVGFTVPSGGNYSVTWKGTVNGVTGTCNGSFSARPPTTVACGVANVDPKDLEPNQDITVSRVFSYTGGPSTPSISNESLVIDGPGGVRNLMIASRTVNESGGTVTLTSDEFTLPTAGQYTLQADIRINGVAPAPVSPCSITFNVLNRPTLSVRGGDVAAGASFGLDATNVCGVTQSNQKAGIASWNHGGPSYQGAGGQYGAASWSYIQGFITNQGNARPGSSLSFSNRDASGQTPDSVSEANGRYGGFFGNAPCVDYWGSRPTSNLNVPAGGGGAQLNGLSGTYMHSGDLTIRSSTISSGTQLTVYVAGDVIIRESIVYGGGSNPSWANLGAMPNFKLIVQGTIHVDPSVDRLDGTYVAVPSGSNYPTATNSFTSPLDGTISTCSTGTTVLYPRTPLGPNIGSACRQLLTVNGSFIANHIFLLRSEGTAGSGQAAEVFNYSPEVWLAPSGDADFGGYESIIGLPPVL